jgi:thiamine-phosphate pyrophosphorylase
MQRFPWIEHSRLWLVLDRVAAAPHALAEAAQRAVLGGVDVVVCRIQDTPLEQVRELAIPVREICQLTHTPFVMSHYVELGLELAADAIHASAADASIETIRAITGDQVALGYSAHAVAEAGEMQSRGADYTFLGPVFPTSAKLQYGDPLGLEVVANALALPKPVVFIGGINVTTLPLLTAAGARRAAAIAALQSVQDITAAARAMRLLMP